MRIGAAVALALGLGAAAWLWSRPAPAALSYEASAGRAAYRAGERVDLRLVVRNETTRRLRLAFPSTQRFDFVVRDASGEMWRWSRGRRFAAAQATEELGPGEFLVYRVTWSQRGADGRPARPGLHQVTGVFAGRATSGGEPVETQPAAFAVGVETPVEVAARSGTIEGQQVGEVYVGRMGAVRIRAAANGKSPAERAWIAATRLRQLAHKGLDPVRLAVREVSGGAAVVWNGAVVITAYPEDAETIRATPAVLARWWRDALAEPLAASR